MRLFVGTFALALLAGCQGEVNAPDVPDAPSALESLPDPIASPAVPETQALPAPPGVGDTKRILTEDSAQCAANEKTIFACKVANGKRVTVCAADEGKVHYRYGGAKVELALQGGKWASVAYSGGGEAQIAFENGDTRYIVFSRIVRTNFTEGEPNNPAISDGVIVMRGDKVLSLQSCDDPQLKPADYDLAEQSLPRVEELFTYETGRADSR